MRNHLGGIQPRGVDENPSALAEAGIPLGLLFFDSSCMNLQSQDTEELRQYVQDVTWGREKSYRLTRLPTNLRLNTDPPVGYPDPDLQVTRYF